MYPQVDMDCLYLDEDMKEWETLIHTTRHTHYPVCNENQEDIVGVLDTKDYFRLEDKAGRMSWQMQWRRPGLCRRP